MSEADDTRTPRQKLIAEWRALRAPIEAREADERKLDPRTPRQKLRAQWAGKNQGPT